MKSFNKIALGLAAATALMISDSYAQGGYFEDALRYSQYRSTGSARIMGIGGTQTSLGGDITNIHENPAGLGFFRRSEAGFTGSYSSWESNTGFLGQIQKNSTNNFSMPNLGVVISKVKGPLELGDWRGGSFGISINRAQLYTNDLGYFSNNRSTNSLLDFYIDDYGARGEPVVGDPAGLPLDVFLIQFNSDVYFKDTLAIDNPFQDETIKNDGAKTQVTFGYGGNYKNKLFVGGSIDVTSINLSSTKTFNEEFFYRGSEKTSLYYSLHESLIQNGTGITVGIGAIYKPMDNFNIGLSFKSPTWTRINEEFDADIFAEYNDLDKEYERFNEESDIYLTTINLRTPMKLSAGGTFFFNKNGFITADVDYIDYSAMNLSSPDFSMNSNNDNIKSLATSTINYRGGAEYRFDIFRVRAGAAFYGDPMKNSGLDRTMRQYSGGIGVRLDKMYIDLGLVQSAFKSYYNSYPGAALAITDHKQTTGLLTVGFNFR